MENPDDFSAKIEEGKPTAKVGETVRLKGHVQNHRSVQNVNWQKYHNGTFVAIDIHKSKYKGTTTNLPNPELVLNEIDLRDGGEYRIEVQRNERVHYSNVYAITILDRGDGVFFLDDKREREAKHQTQKTERPRIHIKTSKRLQLVPYGNEITLIAEVQFMSMPVIRWTRIKNGNTEEIENSSEKFVIDNSIKSCPTLTIKKFDYGDNGNYSITATNGEDTVSDKIELKVKGVYIHVDCQSTIRNGDTVHLKGILHFHHTMKFLKWQKYHNGKFMDINIHNTRYKGSTNALQNPELVINDVNTEDAAKYRIEVQTTESKEYSNEEYVKVSPGKEKPEIEIFSDEQNNRYYIGEDVKIRGIVKNSSAILCMTWQRGGQTINTALPKYAETTNNDDENQLIIRNCSENDAGNYFILATCNNGIEDICSNRIYLDIIKGPPIVSLSQLPEPLIDECVQIRATIRSFPKYTGVIWMKNQEFINTNSPKYEGSKNDDKCSVLSIKNVNREDEKVYTVEITNDLGTTKCSTDQLKVIGDFPIVNISKETQSTSYGDTITLNAKITSRPQPSSVQWKKDDQFIHADGRKYTIENPNGCSTKLSICCLNFEDSGKYTVYVNNAIGTTTDDIDINVKANNIIFIAGPVVVSSSAQIQFQAVYHQPINSRKGEWFRTKNNLSTKLQFGTPGYSIITTSSQPTIQTIEITSQTENGSAFQLSVENTKSNIINVFVDDSHKFPTENEGNCLRFLALQAESKAAMRKYLDCMPGNFNKKWSDFDNFCNTKKGQFLQLLPGTTPRSSSDLDVTIMYAMFRNTIKISPPPTRGWGQKPAANDKGKADDIERIRIYRNKISHENSSNMTTKDFNKSALDLIWAIQRLTDYDGQVIQSICTILNRLFCKGQEFDEMMEELKRFRETAKREDIFRENEDEKSNSTETVTAIDKQAIRLPEHLKRYLGETATIAAFIDPNISTICRVFWQKKNREGVFYTIDINDWKYTGSTLTLPTPTLNVNFIRKEDGGVYRIIVDTFNSKIYNTVQMDVIKGECDEDENSTAPTASTASTPPTVIEAIKQFLGLHRGTESAAERIEFHIVHDSNIVLLQNATIARKKNGEDRNGVCFTNRPIKIGERIYLRVAETHPKWSSSMDFGLTNTNPSSLRQIMGIRIVNTNRAFNYLPDLNDVMCFTLNRNSTLSFSINGIEQNTQRLEHVSVHQPVWLSFDLWGKTRAIEISSRRPKKKPANSYFREYSYW